MASSTDATRAAGQAHDEGRLDTAVTIEEPREPARLIAIEDLQERAWEMEPRGIVPGALMGIIASGGSITIERVDHPSAEILDLRLAPSGRGVAPRAGQFIFLRIGGDDAWREHPFSVAGISPDGHLQLSIRSLGRDTARMHARLAPGLPGATDAADSPHPGLRAWPRAATPPGLRQRQSGHTTRGARIG